MIFKIISVFIIVIKDLFLILYQRINHNLPAIMDSALPSFVHYSARKFVIYSPIQYQNLVLYYYMKHVLQVTRYSLVLQCSLSINGKTLKQIVRMKSYVLLLPLPGIDQLLQLIKNIKKKSIQNFQIKNKH